MIIEITEILSVGKSCVLEGTVTRTHRKGNFEIGTSPPVPATTQTQEFL